MVHFLEGYAGFEILFVAVCVGTTLWIRRRRRQTSDAPLPERFVRTYEVTIDPTTHIRQEVWWDPSTGERVYKKV